MQGAKGAAPPHTGQAGMGAKEQAAALGMKRQLAFTEQDFANAVKYPEMMQQVGLILAWNLFAV